MLVISSYLIKSTLLNFVSYLSAQFIFQHCACITTVGLPVWASFKRKRTISILIRFTVAKKNKTTEKLRADTPFPATPPSVPYRGGHKFNLNNATITNYYRVSRVIETIHQRQWSFCPHSRFLSLLLTRTHNKSKLSLTLFCFLSLSLLLLQVSGYILTGHRCPSCEDSNRAVRTVGKKRLIFF